MAPNSHIPRVGSFLGFSDGDHLPITDSSKLCIFNLITHMSLHEWGDQISSFGPAVTHASTFKSFCSGQTVPCNSSCSCGCLYSVRWNSLLQILQRCPAFGEFFQRGFRKGEFLGYAWDTERRAMFPTSVSVPDMEIVSHQTSGLNACNLGLSPGLVCWMRRQEMT